MRQQTTSHILMVRPANFCFNEETAANNAFQSQNGNMTPDQVRKAAIAEFDAFVEKLTAAGVDVTVAKDSATPVKPDAIFPNNWATYHQEGIIVTYPMFAPTRRRERRKAVINTVLSKGFSAKKQLNMAIYEKVDLFLEGTGSIIFDHQYKLAYACLSPRTSQKLLDELCEVLGYQPVVFHSVDGQGGDIYHTNVMMALGESFVVICMDTVKDPAENALLRRKFAETGKEIIEISLDQMVSYAGNMLQVRNAKGETLLVMSEQAFKSLQKSQIDALEKHTALLHSPIQTIEYYGGGSARCMMAEIFLPQKA